MKVAVESTAVGVAPTLTSRRLHALAARAMHAAKMRTPLRISVAFVTRPRSRELNKRYRGKDVPTNVLSFSLNGTAPSGHRTEHALLGEIILCPAVIRAEARRDGVTVAKQSSHLFVHGLLHLFGYDHEDDRDFRTMHRLERRILGSGIS